MALNATGAVAHAASRPPGRNYRILHIMSYHSPWRWADGQFQGFKEALNGLPAEYQVFQMDTKRQSTPEAKTKAGNEARMLIEHWKPDLVYTTDDDAQEYVTKYYINKDIPFVFSGVNKDPSSYGFAGSRNITGVVEHEHFVESVQTLRKIVPGVRKIAVVFDDAEMWKPVRERMVAANKRLPGVQLGSWNTILTFNDYKRKVKDYHGKADAIALLGIFNFKDGRSSNVPYQEVLQWTAENSSLPDFSFWLDRVHYGTLCAVTVSEHEQGLAAGRIARAILAEGKAPGSFPMNPTVRGLPVVSLARSKKLNLKPPTGLLLSAEVIRKFEWEK
jgi:ABC-type uncharacterized transport system substrate-binding protein